MNKESEDRAKRSLAERLALYGQSDYYPLHMPGHKRRLFGQMPEEMIRMDITEIEGFDNLHQAEGIIRDAQDRAAALYGAEESFFLVNGSTCGILSAVSAAVPEGGHILMARNCHKSAYHACYLRNLTVSYIYPGVNEAFGFCEAVTARDVEEALERTPEVDAVLIVSPTYEGRIAEVDLIAGMLHRRGIPLIVDEAHGAHLGFAQGWEDNSCRKGADLVIHSIHKTMPALTQTALLHVNGNLIDRERLKRFLHIYQSSSPSYLLMASIDNALLLIEEQGRELFGEFARNWNKMCLSLAEMKHLSVPVQDDRQDPGKLPVSVKNTELTGQELYEILLEEYHIQTEMAAPDYVLAMFSAGDGKEGYERLTHALLEIDGRLKGASASVECVTEKISQPECMKLTEAWDRESCLCPIQECEGRWAAEFINLYPPGIPAAVPGEKISKELIRWILDCLAGKMSVQGIKQCDGRIFLHVLR